MPQKITAEYFKKRVGRQPKDDDLHRANCNRAGNIGHFMCGWCNECNKPRFACMHIVTQESPLEG